MSWEIFFANGPAADWILLTAFHSMWLSLAGFLIIYIWKFKAPPIRSACYAFTLILLLLLPVITWIAHKHITLGQPVQEVLFAANVAAPHANAPLLNDLLGIETMAPQAETNQWKAWTIQFGFLWLAVTLGSMGRLLYGLVLLRGYTNCLREVKDDRVALILKEINESLGFRLKPKFFVSLKLPSPVTMGIRNPVVILPAGLYQSIGEEELRAIMAHELAHIHHSDHVLGLLQRFVKAFYWWNPFVYSICNALTAVREEVSDSYAIRATESATSYATLLMRLIEEAPVISRIPCMSNMATPYQCLQRRIRNIVSRRRDLRVKAGKGTMAAISAAAALMCGIVCLGSQVKLFAGQEAFASGNSKPIGAVIKDRRGDLNIESRQAPVPVRATHHNNRSLQSLMETEGGQSTEAVTVPTPYRAVRMTNMARSDAFPTLRNEGADPPQARPIRLDESNPPIVQYRAVLDYPSAAKRAKLSGTVQVAVVVNEKGQVYEARVIMGHPLLHKPALDAVLLWKFEPVVVEETPRPFTTAVDFHF
jgi:TonB family protein